MRGRPREHQAAHLHIEGMSMDNGHGFMFATGIENSYPTIGVPAHEGRPTGTRTRRDEMKECGHYARMSEDFNLVSELGVRFLRWGPPLHLAWTSDGRYDWSYTDAAMREMDALGIIPIVDLCHFGVPDWLGDFQNPDFPRLFGSYARAFADRFPQVRLYTPVNEMHIAATFSARLGWWNEMLASDTAYVTALKHLVGANVLAMRAILEVRPDALFVQSETAEYFHAGSPARIGEAERKNQERFLSLDLNYGRRVDSSMYEFLMDCGMTRTEYAAFRDGPSLRKHCILGLDYYRTNEHRIMANGHYSSCGDVLGFHSIASQYYARYRIPMMHTETNTWAGDEREDGSDDAVDWLIKQWACALRLRNDGIPLVGFTWYSLTDQVDWHVALREVHGQANPLGLYDLDRKIRPVGRAFKRLVEDWGGTLPTRSLALTLP